MMRKLILALSSIGLVFASDRMHGQDCPERVGSWTASSVMNVDVADGLVFIAQGANGLRIVDASDPANPVELGANVDLGTVDDVAVAGSFAYVAAEGAFGVVDISDPQLPTMRGQAPLYGWKHHVAVAYPYAYVASEAKGLVIFDVSVPDAPLEVGSYSGPEYACDIEVKGSVLYLADFYEEGLIVLDISSPSQPVKISNYAHLGNAACVALFGDYLVVGDYWYGLRILDATDPEHLREIGGQDMVGFMSDVAVAGRWAYVSTQAGWLSAVTLDDPRNPVELTFTTMGGSGLGIAVAQGKVYAAEGDAGLEIFSTARCKSHQRPVSAP